MKDILNFIKNVNFSECNHQKIYYIGEYNHQKSIYIGEYNHQKA